MKTLRSFLTVAALLISASSAFGHGFALSLQGNALLATSNDYPGNGNPTLFFGELSELGGALRSSHGGAGTSLFGTGKSLSFDVYTPLLYSNGTGLPAELAADGVSMKIESQSLLGSVDIDRAENFTAGYSISGNTSHEFLWTLSSTGALPAGIYGLAYRVKGGPVAGGSYDPSDLLVVTYSTPGFFLGDDPLAPGSPLSLAQAAIFEAATNPVPEPASCVLLGVGALGLAATAWRKRHRAKAAA